MNDPIQVSRKEYGLDQSQGDERSQVTSYRKHSTPKSTKKIEPDDDIIFKICGIPSTVSISIPAWYPFRGNISERAVLDLNCSNYRLNVSKSLFDKIYNGLSSSQIEWIYEAFFNRLYLYSRHYLAESKHSELLPSYLTNEGYRTFSAPWFPVVLFCEPHTYRDTTRTFPTPRMLKTCSPHNDYAKNMSLVLTAFVDNEPKFGRALLGFLLSYVKFMNEMVEKSKDDELSVSFLDDRVLKIWRKDDIGQRLPLNINRSKGASKNALALSTKTVSPYDMALNAPEKNALFQKRDARGSTDDSVAAIIGTKAQAATVKESANASEIAKAIPKDVPKHQHAVANYSTVGDDLIGGSRLERLLRARARDTKKDIFNGHQSITRKSREIKTSAQNESIFLKKLIHRAHHLKSEMQFPAPLHHRLVSTKSLSHKSRSTAPNRTTTARSPFVHRNYFHKPPYPQQNHRRVLLVLLVLRQRPHQPTDHLTDQPSDQTTHKPTLKICRRPKYHLMLHVVWQPTHQKNVLLLLAKIAVLIMVLLD